jgi:hypothetical protein
MEYKLICKQCGKEFIHGTYCKTYCDECSAIRQRERNRKFMQKKRGGKVTKQKENKSLSQVIRELEEYNKAHGTCISYGQYVALIG